MNIIFLDIDGVLNCELFYLNPKRKKTRPKIELPDENLDRERISWLNGLCERVDAKVVLSSTWRFSGIEYCRNILKQCGATFEIIDVTPNLHHEGCVRGNEIHHWIKENDELLGCHYFDFKSYVIIDDDSDMLLWQAPHFFKTDSYSGLTPNTCYKIEQFFKHKIFFNNNH